MTEIKIEKAWSNSSRQPYQKKKDKKRYLKRFMKQLNFFVKVKTSYDS